MKYYLNINKQPETNGGNYELHKSTCEYYQCGNKDNFIYVGFYVNEHLALAFTKARYLKYAKYIDGCCHCCSNIHKK